MPAPTLERPTEIATDGFERSPYNPERVKVRKTSFDFPDSIPQLFASGSHVRTHLLNSLNLFLPVYEASIARFMRERAQQVQDPYLKEQILGFVGQEAIHGRTHAKFHDNLRKQGYEIDSYLKLCDWILVDLFEKTFGQKLSITALAGFEHYTDILVVLLLDTDFLDHCHPKIKEIMQWHAAEECEHNSVAYETLRDLDNGYLLRQLGNVLGLGIILFFVLTGMAYLLTQDRQWWNAKTWTELGELFLGKYHVLQTIGELFVHYARPEYHPDDEDYSELARRVLNPTTA